MSIIDAAFKQSQTANNTEQAHLAYQQTKQLAFYKKLSIGLAGVGLSVTFALAGFYTGQYIQSQSQPVANVNNNQVQVEEVTGTIVRQQDSVERLQPSQAKLADKVQNTAEVVHSDEQYQWMSVQVGVNEQGAPIFKQQLVPLSAIAQVNTAPAVSSVYSNTTLPEQAEEDLSQYRVLGKPLGDTQLDSQVGASSQPTPPQEDLSHYRVLGKPLESEPKTQTESLNKSVSQSNPENQIPQSTAEKVTDEAAARLKAAFELAVAETEDKDFTETPETAPEKEHLSIEFLPEKTQAAIGKLMYQAHIYATSEHRRWIKINGVELYEGDKINGMRLLEIAPEASVFRFQGYDFAIKAMQDWQPY